MKNYRVHPLTVAIRGILFGGDWAFIDFAYKEGMI